jgi:23S rRNA pseudouridine1911/1915/1917 synthase
MAEREPTVAFRTGDYLIANKPRGMPVHATRDPNRANLLAWARDLAGDAVTLHHRIDVWTSGLVACSTSDAGNRALADAFQTRTITKRYRAVCIGRPSDDIGELRHYLAKRRVDGIDQMLAVRSGGKVAIAHYELETYDPASNTSLVSFELETGRMHQLRVQAAESGWPMLGDALYGDAEANRRFRIEGQLLHAERLAFTDPIHGVPIDVTAEPPPEFELVSR